MLSTEHKANILRKAGYTVPAGPGNPNSPYQTAQCWAKAIDTLYVTYAASRAAKSLRDAEEARMLALLQLRSAKAWA
ncbi:hypothetical protein ABL849_26860 [Variovorax sp. 375MFSha3.1]|uniref:Uncharacterized protein n=1 Tax=Variovorax guangxiensis TaxID=1775474 RepID=A0A3S0XEJ7_9BURK|nr:hypothetical protein [Variovorax guangxiensis]MBB4223569.1 hypothetical protein [Variovorax guangxiensis]RUR71555.1 hypothetical protein EJP67_31370 [Variovorax guangxiensis]